MLPTVENFETAVNYIKENVQKKIQFWIFNNEPDVIAKATNKSLLSFYEMLATFLDEINADYKNRYDELKEEEDLDKLAEEALLEEAEAEFKEEFKTEIDRINGENRLEYIKLLLENNITKKDNIGALFNEISEKASVFANLSKETHNQFWEYAIKNYLYNGETYWDVINDYGFGGDDLASAILSELGYNAHEIDFDDYVEYLNNETDTIYYRCGEYGINDAFNGENPYDILYTVERNDLTLNDLETGNDFFTYDGDSIDFYSDDDLYELDYIEDYIKDRIENDDFSAIEYEYKDVASDVWNNGEIIDLIIKDIDNKE